MNLIPPSSLNRETKCSFNSDAPTINVKYDVNFHPFKFWKSKCSDQEIKKVKHYLLRPLFILSFKQSIDRTKKILLADQDQPLLQQFINSHSSSNHLNHCPLGALLLARYQLITGHIIHWQPVKSSLLTSDSFNDQEDVQTAPKGCISMLPIFKSLR